MRKIFRRNLGYSAIILGCTSLFILMVLQSGLKTACVISVIGVICVPVVVKFVVYCFVEPNGDTDQ